MSVNTGGAAQSAGDLDSFDDIIPQRCTVSQLFNPSAEGTLNGGANEGAVFEVVGENFWNEVPADKEVFAELVAFHLVDDILIMQDDNGTDQPTTAYMDSNFGIQPGREGDVVSVESGNSLDLDGDGTDDITNRTVSNYENHGYLYGGLNSATSTFYSGSSGYGGGGLATPGAQSYMVPFRQLFGRGPIVDESNDLTWNGEFYAFGDVSEGSQFRHQFRAQLYWDIWARDLPTLEDIFAGRRGV